MLDVVGRMFTPLAEVAFIRTNTISCILCIFSYITLDINLVVNSWGETVHAHSTDYHAQHDGFKFAVTII